MKPPERYGEAHLVVAPVAMMSRRRLPSAAARPAWPSVPFEALKIEIDRASCECKTGGPLLLLLLLVGASDERRKKKEEILCSIRLGGARLVICRHHSQPAA